MNLTSEITTGLEGVSSALNDDQFDLTLRNLSLSLENPSASLEVPADKVGVVELKKAYAALFSLVVEGVRWKEDDSTIRNTLKDCKMPEARISKVLSVIGKRRIPLQNSLKQINANFPHIFDVTWKMSHVVKSSYSDIDGKSLFFIDFVVGRQKRTSSGLWDFEVDNVSVVCTVNQLQSLVASLKAATKKFEAIADTYK